MAHGGKRSLAEMAMLEQADTLDEEVRVYRISANPSIYMFGDASAFSVGMEFVRTSNGITHMWLPGEPTCEQLLNAVIRTEIKQSAAFICLLLGSYELSMTAAMRQEKYRKLVQQLNAITKVPIKLVAPLPYPGIEMPAVRAAAQLRSICGSGQVSLLEPTEQFLLGKSARPSLFADYRALSKQGVRLLAVYFQDRSGMPLPPLVAVD